MSRRNSMAQAGLLFLALASPLALAQAPSNSSSHWEPDIKAFEAADRANPPPQNAILFAGSSSIRFWKSLADDFSSWTVINRGFGGSEIADSTAFADRIIFPCHPAAIVFYAGDNDLANGKSADQVATDYKKFVTAVHARLPDTSIIFISIKPCPLRWKLKDKVCDANRQIAAMKEPWLKFVDVYSPMLNDQGQPRPELFKADGLHPSPQCYALWTERIKPFLGPPTR